VGGEGEGRRVREGVGEGERNDSNIVCTYELKKRKKRKIGVAVVLNGCVYSKFVC
jgi:hypothetical protein